MKLEDIQNITVLGAGIMGHGIAQSFLMGGYPVVLYDISKDILETARAHIQKNLAMFTGAGLVEQKEITPCLNRLSTSTDLEKAVADADFVVEAAPENLDLKKSLFEKVAASCNPKTIIASNTSSLTLKEMGERVQDKSRLVVTHWFNPPHIVPTVEVVRSEETSEETVDTAYALMEGIRKTPVKIKREIPGFIVNRIQAAMAREVLDLYGRGIADAADIDQAIRGSIGFRLASIGMLLTMDLGGLKLWRDVCKNLLSDIESSRSVPDFLEKMISEGQDGIKSGKGFYDYAVDFSKEDLDRVIQQRDKEFINRLKNLYLEK